MAIVFLLGSLSFSAALLPATTPTTRSGAVRLTAEPLETAGVRIVGTRPSGDGAASRVRVSHILVDSEELADNCVSMISSGETVRPSLAHIRSA